MTATPIEPGLKYTRLNPDGDEAHQLLVSQIGAGMRVLEVGSATGFMTAAMVARGAVVTSIEVDPAAAALARESGFDVRVGRLEDVDLEVAAFDVVLLADVVEHVVDASAFLERALAFLRPGGALLLSVPNVAHWTVRLSLLMGRFEYERTGLLDETHVRFYTAASLERLLAKHGMRVTDRRVSLGLSRYPTWRWRRARQLQRSVVRFLGRRLPGLFGFQFVWKAVTP